MALILLRMEAVGEIFMRKRHAHRQIGKHKQHLRNSGSVKHGMPKSVNQFTGDSQEDI